MTCNCSIIECCEECLGLNIKFRGKSITQDFWDAIVKYMIDNNLELPKVEKEYD